MSWKPVAIMARIVMKWMTPIRSHWIVLTSGQCSEMMLIFNNLLVHYFSTLGCFGLHTHHLLKTRWWDVDMCWNNGLMSHWLLTSLWNITPVWTWCVFSSLNSCWVPMQEVQVVWQDKQGLASSSEKRVKPNCVRNCLGHITHPSASAVLCSIHCLTGVGIPIGCF